MNWLLADDPGVKAMAWAVFAPGGNLWSCGLVPKPRCATFASPTAASIAASAIASIRVPDPLVFPAGVALSGVVEQMVVYPPRTAQEKKCLVAKANDLILLSNASSLVMGHFCGPRVTYLTPGTWKGTRPKEVTQYQVLQGPGGLTADEKKVLQTDRYPPSLWHNLFDVVGLGLVHLGRIKGR